MIFNTGESSEELREKYNPKGSLMYKAQQRMLDMWLYLDDICKKLNIQYRLDGGSILGAVRHKGFIPWDDDMDLAFERKDLERLKKYLLLHPHPQFILQTHETDSGFWGSWYILRDMKSEYLQDSTIHNSRKFRGLQIDLFPYDKGNIYLLQYISMCLYNITSCLISQKKYRMANFLWNVNFKMLFPIFRLFNIFGDKCKSSHSYGTSWITHYHNIEDCLPYKKMEFEGYKIWGPSNPNNILKKIYGDFMKLPEIENRNKHEAILKIWE